jgi:hypothetical protein
MYEQRAVLFLDILGFSQLVKDGKEHRLLAALQHLQGRALEAQALGKMNFTAFSDCVVVSTPLDGGAGALRIIYYAQFLALDLLSRGFLTRGAIVAGPLFHEGGIVLGPALVDAYALESKKALYPRILVSSDIITTTVAGFLKSTDRSLVDSLSFFREDFDGYYHVDIFAKDASAPEAYRDDFGEDDENRRAVFLDALLTYIDRIFAAPPPEVAAEKYAWLARYFFETCSKNLWPLPNNLPVPTQKRMQHEKELYDQIALDSQE